MIRWVVSTHLPVENRGNRAEARLYNPFASGGSLMQDHFWRIVYGDRSSASGLVYQDKVTIGGLTVANQAVQTAANISTLFMHDGSKDGLLGLGFSRGNTVQPARQPTWFENIRPRLDKPLFTSTLKRHGPGTYDFGYIDESKYTGPLFWTNLAGKAPAHWDFFPGAVLAGNSLFINQRFLAIVDTGTSLWYMPDEIVDDYWKSIKGATFKDNRWVFPCKSNLTDIIVLIGDGTVTVPGINMNYSKVRGLGSTMCVGGLQRELPGLGYSIFGDVFMKGQFIVHYSEERGRSRLGFAKAK
jgi:aspergillopepsin I